MKKPSLKFMNRLEQAIFKNYADAYTAVSATVTWSALIAAFASIIVIFFLQMFNADESSATVVLSIAFGLALIFSGYTAYKAMVCLPTIGAKIGLGAYVLVLFAICSFLSIWLAVWVVIIALVILVVWVILKLAFPNSKGKKRYTVYYSDGTSESAEEDGRGICGEQYVKTESGENHIV